MSTASPTRVERALVRQVYVLTNAGAVGRRYSEMSDAALSRFCSPVQQAPDDFVMTAQTYEVSERLRVDDGILLRMRHIP